MEICVGSHRIRQKKIPIQGETEADTIGQSATEACPALQREELVAGTRGAALV